MKIKRGDNIRLTKLEATVAVDGMLSTGYTLKGYLLNDKVTVGDKLIIDRYERNGLAVAGLFTSTEVKKIEDNVVYTQNSIWEIEII